MPDYAVLLRGVNVGKGNRIAMADFRELLESLGCSEVRTLLNSGNAVCRSSARSSAALAKAIAAALRSRARLDVPVVVKSEPELAAIVKGNALAPKCKDPARLWVAFPRERAALGDLAPLKGLVRAPERFEIGSEAAYLQFPSGSMRSKAAMALLANRAVTTRNWATTLKLQALIEGRGA